MKAFPLETLLKVREHREQKALQVVADHKAYLAARLSDMQVVNTRLTAIRSEIEALGQRLTASAGKGEYSVAGLTGIDARRALLRDQTVIVTKELESARAAVEKAREGFAESVRAYRKARAKKDSAVVQREQWAAKEQVNADRRDEAAAEDITMSRYIRTER